MTLPLHWHALLSEQGLHALSQAEQYVATEVARGKEIYPPDSSRFSALDALLPEQVKVVILGQDPYHGYGQAHGYAFSVPHGIAPPPSLKNIYKALADEVEGFQIPSHGNLTGWAQEGVLLLNTVLTVEAGKAGSHQGIGWETVTKELLQALAKGAPKVFMLWGKQAQQAVKGIDLTDHFVLTGAHPSPLSAYRGFFSQQHFFKANEWLQKRGLTKIRWQVICDDLLNF